MRAFLYSCVILLFVDIDPQAVPPRWPPSAESLVVKDGTYELTAVPLTSITYVTNKTLKVCGRDTLQMMIFKVLTRLKWMPSWIDI